ncbi:MAG: dolichyl-phosphate beta-glucosyltransferase [Candidatus Moraniibacteriota bacterium]
MKKAGKSKAKNKKSGKEKNIFVAKEEKDGTLAEELAPPQTRAIKGEEVILSVVIPAYKEEKRIGNTLLSLDKYLSRLNFPYEILVVIDGSPDNTFAVVEKYQKMIKNLWIINNPDNHGKGYVVRQAMLAAKGAYRLFMDADNAVTIDQIEQFSPHFEDPEVGIVIGSRDIKGANVKVHQPYWKELFGNMGNVLIQAVTGLWGIKDTQCGFKIITAKAAELVFPMMTINRWGFDFEMLTLMKKLGFKIAEAPVVWVDSGVTGVNLRAYLNTLRELFKVRWNFMFGKYDIKGALERKNA